MPEGHAKAQAVSRLPLTEESRIQSQASPRGIRGGESQKLTTPLNTTWDPRWAISALDNAVIQRT
jgi:hypothetical protein